MGKIQKRLLWAVSAGIVLVLVLMVLVQGMPTGRDFVTALGSYDPFLAMLLPGQEAEASAQTDPDYRLQDDKDLYNLDDLGQVVTLLVEVYPGGKGESLGDLETGDAAADIRLPVIVQEGTSKGTVKWEGLGYSAVAVNATIEVRGAPKANRKYHNFKLRLEDGAGQFEGQSILNLKKGYSKPCRVEEKFAFDLFSTLPDTLSMRTRFAQLYIKDMTANNPGYEDYGLYTMVEQPDEFYFVNRALDDSGSLYQAEDFDFSMAPALKQVSSHSYSKKDFEKILDIKQGDSHEALLEMLQAVNDRDADIDRVLDTYFDRENLFTWLAMNVILGNSECVTQNYLIYKPTTSQRWFFVPSNMSGAMPAGGDEQITTVMHSGCSMFYGNVLYERVLEKPGNVQALRDKVDQLMARFTQQYVDQLTNQYAVVLAKYLAVNPDRGTMKQAPEQAVAGVARYRQAMEANVEAFTRNLDAPRRVELLKTRRDGGGLVFQWTALRQLGGEPLQYTLEVAEDSDFARVIEEVSVEDATEVMVDGLPPGLLYWRVSVTDAQGRSAGSVNVTELEDGSLLYGAATALVIQ